MQTQIVCEPRHRFWCCNKLIDNICDYLNARPNHICGCEDSNYCTKDYILDKRGYIHSVDTDDVIAICPFCEATIDYTKEK